LTSKKIAADYGLLVWILVATPIFSSLASIPPALSAVLQDPAIVLCKE
jgi:ABC-type lipoprotein release transport system permease subunit